MEVQDMKTEFKPPQPVDGVDFYVGEIYQYTVCIEVYVEGLEELCSETGICCDAVEKFQNGEIDGDATIVHKEHVRDVELCFDTDEPFDHKEWQKAKLLELGINTEGKPLRPSEKKRPPDETTLNDFTVVPIRELSYNDAEKEISDYIKKAGDRKVYISEIAEELAIEFKLIEDIMEITT